MITYIIVAGRAFFFLVIGVKESKVSAGFHRRHIYGATTVAMVFPEHSREFVLVHHSLCTIESAGQQKIIDCVNLA